MVVRSADAPGAVFPALQLVGCFACSLCHETLSFSNSFPFSLFIPFMKRVRLD